ncbi:MAG TPA: hypothetical protein VND64_15255 [Pirellulales bacterium]|nr:hypothetical protein [Pirellulales bacterium]
MRPPLPGVGRIADFDCLDGIWARTLTPRPLRPKRTPGRSRSALRGPVGPDVPLLV